MTTIVQTNAVVLYHKHLSMQVSYKSRYGVEVDPDSRDAKVTQDGIEITKKFITKYFTGISATPSVVEPCIVTVSE